jgi:hypothetical protein
MNNITRKRFNRELDEALLKALGQVPESLTDDKREELFLNSPSVAYAVYHFSQEIAGK